MSLADLASLGSFVSGFAVLVSLPFLYVQMRQIGAQIVQTERNQRAAIRSERTSRSVEAMIALLDPSAADAISLGNMASPDMTVTQLRQYGSFCLLRFTAAEDSFDQHTEGLLSDSAFEGMVTTLRRALRSPGFRSVWRIQRPTFQGGFVQFMDRLLAETEVQHVPDYAELYKAAFAAEKARTEAKADGQGESFAIHRGPHRP
jgi:hypothetical protein